MSRRIRIIVVDGSSAARGTIRRRLQACPDLEVVATTGDPHDAVSLAAAHEADVVTVDSEAPDLLTVLPRILSEGIGVRVVVVSAMTESSASRTIQALRQGAADFVCTPCTRAGVPDLAAVAEELACTIRGLVPAWELVAPDTSRTAYTEVAAGTQAVTARPPAAAPPRRDTRPRVLVVGASTGGPQALSVLLGGLPADFDLPVLVAQHMPDLFLSMLAQRLSSDTDRHVVLGRNGAPVRRGVVYIAPGDRHMVVTGTAGAGAIALRQDPPENFCRPAVNPLFRSAARVWGPSVLAVVLTGMGEDGLAGAEAIVAAGGRVLTQDEDSSVVWGMPGTVTRAGLSTACLPLSRLPAKISALSAGGA